jgi:hypothetical protein
MPLWAPARGVNRFLNDPSLSPFQIAQIASWIEARTPRGAETIVPRKTAVSPAPAGPVFEYELDAPLDAQGIGRHAIKVPTASGRGIRAWRFEPGDPALRQAVFRDDGGRTLWTWIPGMPGETFPKGTTLAIGTTTLQVETSRRIHEADGRARPPRRQPSRLRLWLAPATGRRLEIVSVPCGGTSQVGGHLYAIRPSSPGASRIALSREGEGAAPIALFAARPYPLLRTYWLRDPADLRRHQLRVDGSACDVELVISRPAR